MLDLFILMMERVGLIILLAFLLVNVTYFKRVLENRTQLSSKVILIIVFGLFAILTNFTGIEITGNQIVPSNFLTHISENTSIANARTLVISVAGLVGGPSVGTTVGGIAGVHRFLQGSGEGSFYIFSSLLIGLISGLVRLLLIKRQWQNKALIYALVGILMESIQMIFVAFFSGTDLAKMIAGPMIMINGIGTFIFMSIINVTLKQEEQAKAVQTHDVLNLAAQTLPYFRAGLKRESSQAVAEIIQRYTKLAAISMTDKHQILAHVGAGSDHHIPELEVITELSKKVLQTG
ncbi:LytS/YhcK type 5TM receptor domain-containing protein, partial [Enterococcus canintestini]